MAGGNLIFLKLGGSLITDKLGIEAVRQETLRRLAAEIAAACKERPDMSLVLGHGSGSFGHAHAAHHQTQHGVKGAEQWQGFCRVGDAAARLNQHVRATLLDAGLPVVTIQPSASAICHDGVLADLSLSSVRSALEARLVPLVYGDVAFDTVRGGTIISTEAVLGYLAQRLQPQWLLLAGNTTGVFDGTGQVAPHITPANVELLANALGGSAGVDVTGGMESKVRDMLRLAAQQPGLSIRIFSGLEPGRLHGTLLAPQQPAGTLITA